MHRPVLLHPYGADQGSLISHDYDDRRSYVRQCNTRRSRLAFVSIQILHLAEMDTVQAQYGYRVRCTGASSALDGITTSTVVLVRSPVSLSWNPIDEGWSSKSTGLSRCAHREAYPSPQKRIIIPDPIKANSK